MTVTGLGMERTELRRRTYLASLDADLADARMKATAAADALQRLSARPPLEQLAAVADRLERTSARLQQCIARIREESAAAAR